MQAEFIACHVTSKQAFWLKNLVTAMKVVDLIQMPMKIYCDNKAVVLFSKNNKKTLAALMDTKYLSLRDEVRKWIIEIEHIDTNLMVADPLTQPLPKGVFKNHVSKIGVVESFDDLH
ncbi:hypothetical protein ACFXTI_041301 [Malus domestica]